MPLTDVAIRNAKPGITPKGIQTDKSYKMGDAAGLYLEVSPTGGKWWRLKYRFGGKEKRLSLGTYPDVSLQKARERRESARKLLADGVDPGEHRKAVKASGEEAAANSFSVLCYEWLQSRIGQIEPDQIAKSTARLEKDVMPWIGKKPISTLTAPDVLSVMRRIDARGARYTAHKVKSEISQIIRYAIATGRAERDPCPDLRGALPPPVEIHRPSITTPKEVAELLRAVDGFRGTFPVKCALLLAPLLFVRPGELRKAKWAEIDLERAEWCYYVKKGKLDHLVPLASQAVAILRELHSLTGNREYVFPGRDPKLPMSDAAINAALRRMGYDTKTEITGHGFRAMARTILSEQLRIQPEVIEHQLAHRVPDALGTAYNRTKFIDDRVVMMQMWANYLDKLKAGADVLPFQQEAA
jgi:integrase